MDDYEIIKLRAWRAVLQDIARDFGNNRSIGNIIDNISARIANEEKRRKSNKENDL